MPPRSSTDWLYGFQTGTDWFLACGSGLQQVTANLYKPHAQFPSTVLLIGKHESEAARQALLPGYSHSRSRGIAQLQADGSTSNNEHPLLVASLDIDNAYSLQKPPQKHAGSSRHKVRWLSEQSSSSETESFVEIIVGRLLLLFVDVVCIFLDDFASREQGVQFLQRCAHHSSSSQGWKPQVILVSSSIYTPKVSLDPSIFGRIRRLPLPINNRKALPSSRFSTLKKSIFSSIEIMKKSRSRSKMLYSAYHLNLFFESALCHVAKCASPPFNFVLATRQCNRIEDHLWLYLRNFLRLCAASHVSREATLEYMASAIMLDSFPPGMHRKCSTRKLSCFDSNQQASNRRRSSTHYTNLTALKPFLRCLLNKVSLRPLHVCS
jgi:hypothetical protein